MDRVPPELLSSFFQAFLPIPAREFSLVLPGHKRAEAIQSLRMVSKRWNEAVLETPTLWSYIELSPTEAALLRVHQSLKRSKAAPLHIRVQLHDVTADLHRPEVRRAVDALWEEAYRWNTYVITTFLPMESIHQNAWFKLVPPVPLPNLREAWIMGSEHSSFITELNAPRINILAERGVLTKISLPSLPDLLSWKLAPPSRQVEWERLGQIVRAAPNLAVLQFTATPKEDNTSVGKIAEVMQSVDFPALMEFITNPGATSFGFLSKIRAPNLEILVIENYFSEIPFSIPSLSSCPKLKLIRFSGHPRLSAIRGVVSSMAPDELNRLNMEIEIRPGIRPFSTEPAAETPQRRKFSEHVKWFEERFSVSWLQA
ncbi:hypothetical protein FRC04_002084 [Tulasnella sp. 424]|nr:hypothetical protein FRC04_002084 [Tulasnella sp. 424]KAG8968000.1 hypothetical protein FRC05_001710 [Tulasnella sp. 425]